MQNRQAGLSDYDYAQDCTSESMKNDLLNMSRGLWITLFVQYVSVVALRRLKVLKKGRFRFQKCIFNFLCAAIFFSFKGERFQTAIGTAAVQL